MELDRIDRMILSLLQQDSTLSLNDLAEAVNLTTTPCWKRLKKLEESGVIAQRVALLDPEKLDLSFTAFVLIKTSDHSHEWYSHFVVTVSEYPEVMEFYRMAGEYDYMMKVLVKDMKCFDQFYKKLVNGVKGINNVTSTFAMESLKYTTQLPLA
ncbi:MULTISPECIES: Lrp/AsnC family transcriptional regulator [Vibrio]|jgi:Lrp/AsnC family transcriptional regulator|uniref:DNA-binding transcriptional activator DecR n=4 Tax=Vibrio TaxID=662 RepID=A0AAW4B6Y5_VIBAN|nr:MULTISPECIES: Lrp/AsnC family transcriptional regulator [Vibrio]OXX72734.1 transcriptional regulator [Vibrio sp. V03_P4A6T147]ASU22637.1 Lrp/AsnC family transcriptional regulator [Vibrio qinghaiensis]MBF4433436.1 Lrp/AsnC family transcriptional regulator [Vibrio anguillarum]MDQ2163492.1 Lrp/AsnC family transcriptional regulator [Vibrio anguillarum]NAW91407.1 winged helix-turn-helix transcriptional regulator [Vibrio sp. V24_P1S3T111]